MALSIKKSSWIPDSANMKEAGTLQKGMWVELKVIKPDAATLDKWKLGINGKESLFDKTYKLVLSEPIELNVETEWTESAGAEIAKKLNQIFNSKAIKIFAGAKGSNQAPTDSWTQKTTEIGKPLSSKLKFRIYHTAADEKNSEAQSYMDMLQFLTLLCAPRKMYSVASQVVDPLIGAAQNSKAFFENLKADSLSKDEFDEDEPEEPGADAKPEEIAKYQQAKQKYETTKEQAKMKKRKNMLEIQQNSKGGIFASVFNNIRYNFTLQLKSTIFNFNLDNTEMDWYVKSFNWKPSTEIKFIEHYAYPLWVDFEVNLETCCSWPQSWINKINLTKY